MGLLLMQFEYNRAKQKQTVLEHQGIRLNQKHESYTKRIGKITELFNKKKTALDSKYTQRNSQITAAINAASANGTLFQAGGLNSVFSGITTIGLTSLATALYGADGTSGDAAKLATIDASTTEGLNKQKAQQAAIVAQIQSYMQTVLNELKEAELAELEEREDAQTAPIADKDTEIQSKISVNETLTTMADQRVESAKSRLAQVAKDSMAHYGLS